MTRADRRARMDHILARYQAGEPAKVLAREYGLSAQHIISTAWRRRKQGGAALEAFKGVPHDEPAIQNKGE